MKAVRLRTGIEEAEPLVGVVMLSLRRLANPDLEAGDRPGNVLAFYDLVSKCRNPSYQFFGNNETVLCDFGLINKDGSIHESIRNIVLAAVEGDGMDMKLVSPVEQASVR